MAGEYAARTMRRRRGPPYGGAVRSRLTDLGIAAIPIVLGLTGPGNYNFWWSVPLGTAIGLSLYWRRRHPDRVLAVCFALGLVQLAAAAADAPSPRVLPGFYDFGIIIAVYSAVAYGSRAARLAAVAGGSAGAVGASLVWVTSVRDVWIQVYAVCLLFAPVLVAWALGTAARTRRAYLGGLEDRAARLQREREALARAAVAEERMRIARELHDIVAHGVSLMIVASDGAEAALDQGNAADAHAAVAAIGRTGRSALTDLRSLVGVLRGAPGTGEPQPGTAQLLDLIDNVPLKAALRVDGEPRELQPGLALAVYRIVQEALTNTVKHSGPDASADVRLWYGEGAIEVEVTDDGGGPPAGVSAGHGPVGHGLIGMRERAAMFGGTFAAGPRACGGFRVLARLPWT